MNMSGSRSRFRPLRAVLAGMMIALLGAIGFAVPAQADVVATVSNVDFTTDTVQSGRSATLSGDWSVPDSAMGTATFELALPPALQGQPQSFPMKAADGSDTGVCTTTTTTFMCEIDLNSPYFLLNPENRAGSFEFQVTVRTEVTETTEVTYDIDDHTATVSVTPPATPGTCTEDCEYPGNPTGDKQGWTSAGMLYWLINPQTPAEGFTAGQTIEFKDMPVGNHEVDPASWRLRATFDLEPGWDGSDVPAFDTVWTSENPTDIPEAPVLSEDGTTLTITAQEGAYYQVWLRTNATDGGDSVEYVNQATTTVGTETSRVHEKRTVWAGGSATGIGTGLARFSLVKAVDVPGAEEAGVDFSTEEFIVDWTVTGPDGAVETGVATLVPGERWTSDLFSTGSVVHLEEVPPVTAPDGVTWTEATFSQNDIAMPDRSDTLVTLTNAGTYEEPAAPLGGFSVTKELELPDGMLVDSATEFEVVWSADMPDESGAQDASGTLLISAGETELVESLPVGTVVHLEELAAPDPIGGTWNVPEWSANDFTIEAADSSEAYTAVTLTNSATPDEPGTTPPPPGPEPAVTPEPTPDPTPESPVSTPKHPTPTPDALATTGAEPAILGLAALGLITAGVLAMAARRRLRR